MSEQDQDRQKKFENDEDAGEDVEAHVKHRPASDENDGGDDVEAHVKHRP